MRQPDVIVEREGETLVLIDTAGVRKRKSWVDDIEYYSHQRAKEAITRADVCVLLLDAREEVIHVRGEGFTRQRIFTSRHGPLLETVATRPDPRYRLALCWTGHQASSEVDTLLGMWRANDMATSDTATK